MQMILSDNTVSVGFGDWVPIDLNACGARVVPSDVLRRETWC